MIKYVCTKLLRNIKCGAALKTCWDASNQDSVLFYHCCQWFYKLKHTLSCPHQSPDTEQGTVRTSREAVSSHGTDSRSSCQEHWVGCSVGFHHSYTCLSKCNSSLPRTLQHLLCFLHLLSKDCPGLQCSGHCVGLASLWPQIGAGSAGGFGVYWTAFEYCLELSYIHQWGWSLIGKLLFHCVPD